jgi:hypothetical protein
VPMTSRIAIWIGVSPTSGGPQVIRGRRRAHFARALMQAR